MYPNVCPANGEEDRHGTSEGDLPSLGKLLSLRVGVADAGEGDDGNGHGTGCDRGKSDRSGPVHFPPFKWAR